MAWSKRGLGPPVAGIVMLNSVDSSEETSAPPDSARSGSDKEGALKMRRESTESCIDGDGDGIPVMPTRSKADSAFRIACKRQLADAVDYGLEFVPSPLRARALSGVVDKRQAEMFCQAVRDHDIVLIGSTYGWCGCRRAIETVARFPGRCKTAVLLAGRDDDLGLHLAIRAALGRRGAPVYPIVIIRGTYVGGVSDMERIFMEKEAFMGKEALPRYPRVKYGGPPAVLAHEPALDRPFDPRRDANGVHWLKNGVWQRHFFANGVRAVSACHVVLCVAAAALAPSPAASLIVALLLWDWIALLLVGPVPLAPVSVLATAAVWRGRGGAVPSGPYKFIFFLYLLGAATALAEGGATAIKAFLGSAAVNSAILAVLRFWPGTLAASAVGKVYQFVAVLANPPKAAPRVVPVDV